MVRYLILIGFLLGTVTVGSAQPGLHLTVDYQYGRLLVVEDFLRGENALGRRLTAFAALGVQLTRQRPHYRAWEQRHRYPIRGYGLRRFWLDHPAALGRPVAAYRYFQGVLVPGGRLRLSYRSELGLSTGWKPYDYRSNSFNNLMGSRMNAYVYLGLDARVVLGAQWEAQVGYGFSHFSNANVRRPNAGLNAHSLNLGLRYRPRPHPPHPDCAPLPAFRPYTETLVSVFGGVERRLYYLAGLDSTRVNDGLLHGLGGVSVLRARRISAKSAFGLGATLYYRSAAAAEVIVADRLLRRTNRGLRADNLQFSLFPSYAFTFDRFSALVQAEIYLHRPQARTFARRLRQKIGLRYRITDRLFAAAILNAKEFTVAEFLEWHVGYRLGGPEK